MVVLEAPAPQNTALDLSHVRPVSFRALIMPASVTHAVPWASSCQTGIPQSCRLSRTLKQLGWEMSSRFTAPNDGATMRVNSMILSAEWSWRSLGCFQVSLRCHPSSTWELMHRGTADMPPR